MLNTNNSISFSGKISITRFKNKSNYTTSTTYTSLTDDRLLKLTANAISNKGKSFKAIENSLAAPFARLIELISGEKIKIGEQRKFISNGDNQIIFQDKVPHLDGESVSITFDERLDLE